METILEGLKLTKEGIEDQFGKLTADDIPVRNPVTRITYHTDSEFIIRLTNLAVSIIEESVVNHQGKTYLSAGKTFGLTVFPRDICISGLLCINDMMPEVMKTSIKYTREMALELLYKTDEAHYVPEVQAPWELVDELSAYGRVLPVTRRTDDILWIPALWPLIKDEPSDYEWFYETAIECFSKIYNYAYDKKDGLYRGQSVFIDIHYPWGRSSGYPDEENIADCFQIKTCATNCVYKGAMDIMAIVCEKLGKAEEAEDWKQRAKSLKSIVKKTFRRSDGSMAYYKDKLDKVQDRTEILGTAFSVLFDVLEGEDAIEAFKNYPVTSCGVPLIHPFYHIPKEERQQYFKGGIYHNYSSWPFADTLFMLAKEKATGENYGKINLALVARVVINTYTFKEYVDFTTGKPIGSDEQLWTAASFINAAKRCGLIDY